MPEPKKTTAFFPDWVMLDRTGRTNYYDAGDHEARDKVVGVDPTAVVVKTPSGGSGYCSFTLASPPAFSYLDLYWPIGETTFSGFPIDPVYASVVAADKNLVLLSIAIPSLPCYYDVPHDLFVYTAAVHCPSLERLPLDTVPAPNLEDFRKFFVSKFDIGILRLAGDQGHYVVADLIVSDNNFLQLCVFSSAAQEGRKVSRFMGPTSPWRVFTRRPQLENGGKFPLGWMTSTVVPFDGRFLCWVDYFSGLLLSDFSKSKAPVLRFVPFPGLQYTGRVLRTVGRCCPDRFRSVSISKGKMCFVHIDNDFHQSDMDQSNMDCEDADLENVQNSVPKITIWTLNVAEFKWEQRCQIGLDKIWAQPIYQHKRIPQGRLPEFPVISVDNPDLVWCLLRHKEFHGKTWMAELDMKRSELRSCTPYVNEQPYCDQNIELKNSFANVPPLPTAFSKDLTNTTGIVGGRDKFANRASKKGKLSRQGLEFRQSC
ncbi:unnamed protein product [Alopecurus aequalis]